MGSRQTSEIDAWVRAGGIVVASSERARRALLAQYHRARRAEGLGAWNSPPIYDYASFVREQWNRSGDSRLVLSAIQEESLWRRVIAEQNPNAALLRDPLRRLATMAMDAHGLLCSHAPAFLQPRARKSWRQDAEAFSRWIAAFDALCHDGGMVSTSRLPLHLAEALAHESRETAPLLLVGFDRVPPAQGRLLQAWGTSQHLELGPRAGQLHSYAALDGNNELTACAAWCRKKIGAQPEARILIITQESAKRRGEIERTFLLHANADTSFRFEFSLGVPLSTVNVIRSAQLLLGWLRSPVEEAELDWLFSSSYATAEAQEAAQLQKFMRELRRRGLQRMSWTLDALISLQVRVRAPLPPAWIERMSAAQEKLAAAPQRTASLLDWAELVPRLLETMGWPGSRQLDSLEYQAVQRFERVLETCGSLGFDGRRMDWPAFSAELNDALAETLFAPESEDAPITIAGPAESAGLAADAIWFLGAHEDAWPARGALHPLLPVDVQREAGMPHASAQADFEMAQTITQRLAASAEEICFSYPRLDEDVETRPSRLIAPLAGEPIPLPADASLTTSEAHTVSVEDTTGIPISPGQVHGGAAVLTAQSQCPFRGFALARLEAGKWDAAEPGLTPPQRGQILHDVLHNVWASQSGGLHNLDDLRAIVDLRAFVLDHVERVMQDAKFYEIRQQVSQRYLALEAERLTRLITEWLAYESRRSRFDVEETEFKATANVAGVSLDVRLDRVDRLADGSVLVVDYKTGDVTPKAWELPRPDDVQLPLYAGFGLPETWQVAGLAFAKIRAGDVCFEGCVLNAEEALGPVANIATLKRSALKDNALDAWRAAIEALARDFLAGRADVNPRDPDQTCKACGLQTLCRIHERAGIANDEASEEDAND